jgi:hypothetical protein
MSKTPKLSIFHQDPGFHLWLTAPGLPRGRCRQPSPDLYKSATAQWSPKCYCHSPGHHLWPPPWPYSHLSHTNLQNAPPVVQVSESWWPYSSPSHHHVSWASAIPYGTLWTQIRIHLQATLVQSSDNQHQVNKLSIFVTFFSQAQLWAVTCALAITIGLISFTLALLGQLII